MSLEEQFEVQLRKHLDDTGHFAREASAKLLEKLNEDGVLATIKQYLGPIEGKVGNRFWRFGLTDPLSVRMLEIGRPDLTVFSFVLRPEWAELFTEDQRSWARRMLEKEQCASEEALWWLKSRKEQVDADCDDDE